MPDWLYLTLFYPLLRRRPGGLARDWTLGVVGALAGLPGGPHVIAAFGHMDPPAGLSARLVDLQLRSPVGIAAEVDPRLLGTAAVARFGARLIW